MIELTLSFRSHEEFASHSNDENDGVQQTFSRHILQLHYHPGNGRKQQTGDDHTSKLWLY